MLAGQGLVWTAVSMWHKIFLENWCSARLTLVAGIIAGAIVVSPRVREVVICQRWGALIREVALELKNLELTQVFLMSGISWDLFQNLGIWYVAQAWHVPLIKILMLCEPIIEAGSADWPEAHVTSPASVDVHYVWANEAEELLETYPSRLEPRLG